CTGYPSTDRVPSAASPSPDAGVPARRCVLFGLPSSGTAVAFRPQVRGGYAMFFFAIVVGITAVLHLYLWHRLAWSITRRGSRWRLIGLIAIGALALGLVASLVINGEYAVFAWSEYLWLALMFYLVVTLLVLEVPRLAVGWWPRRRARSTPPDTAPQA